MAIEPKTVLPPEGDKSETISTPAPQSTAADTVNHKTHDRALIGGVAWTASMRWLSLILTWASTLIVARLLQPSDYGLIGMAAIFLGIVQLLSEFGLGTAILTIQDLTDAQVSQLNSVSLLAGVAGVAFSVALAIPISEFFRAPKLPPVILVMSIAFVTSSFSVVPRALLQKEMRFKLLAVIAGMQSAAQAIATLILAFLGFGYWALVLGNLAFSITATLLTLVWKRQRFLWPRVPAIRGALVYSWRILASRLSWYAYTDGDFVIAGRVLGEAPLGNYTLAWTLAHVPLEKLTAMVNQITPSIFAAVQTDFVALRRYLRNIAGALSLIVFPIVVGMALVANDFVRVAMGDKWLGVVLPLQLLAFHVLVRSNVVLLTPVLNVVGEERFSMWNSVVMMAVLLPSFYIGSHWGTGGIAGAWVVVYPCLSLPLFWRLFRKIKMPIREYMGALWPAISGCILMAVAVEICKHSLTLAWPRVLDLILEIATGAVVYALSLIAMHRKRLLALIGVIRILRGQTV